MNKIAAYSILILYLLIADYLWLTIQKPRYNGLVRRVQGSNIKVKMGWAALTYIVVVASVVLVALPMVGIVGGVEGSKASGWELLMKCLVYGGGVGLCIYGIFNLTNMSIFNGYDMGVALLDTLWGVFLYTTSCLIFFTIT